MVKICEITNYPNDNESKYKKHHTNFKYPLHIFQKWAIEGIVEGNHILVTAPTGSGKSLPAEFALEYFHSKGKKTIYCSPIKSLSNQKFYDFTQKYPTIRVGIITGDIRCNPDADVLIMTTEILLNKLYQIKSNSIKINSSVSFEMDIETELGCVIFDEIHMINDSNRGVVWENSIILLPKHIQIIGLSATLDNPVRFANWIETRGDVEKTNDKIVYLTSKKDRSVPLTHYSFITVTQGVFKAIKDKAVQTEIRSIIDKPFVIQDSKGIFNEEHYFKMNKMLTLFENKDIKVKRAHVLNQVSKYLTENEMTPAICYVFSRKQIEVCVKEVTTNLQEFDSKVPYIAQRECEQVIRKLPNFDEYLNLPEYINLVSLLERGVAYHHSGMLPVLREIVEMFFTRGYIKLLFATESVAIGLNLPVKTAIFTDVNKHDGTNMRILQAHEYTQAAGRAGRLGLDTVGNVFHLNNLFRNVDSVNYRTMLNGKPQTLSSKFKISYNLILSLIDIGDTNFGQFSRRSMIQEDINNELNEIISKKQILQSELDKFKISLQMLKTPEKTINDYIDLQNKKNNLVNKKRKEVERQIQQIQDNYKNIDSDKNTLEKYNGKNNEFEKLEKEQHHIEKYLDVNVDIILELLEKEGFICRVDKYNVDKSNINLTIKGQIASNLREIHCLAFAQLLENNSIDHLSSKQLIALFSCFTNISIQDDFKDFTIKTDDKLVETAILKVTYLYTQYLDKELDNYINTGVDYNYHYDLINYVIEWSTCETEADCKRVLQKIGEEKGIFLGEFVKALLKINNISCEMEKIAELTGNISFLSKLREIPQMTMKYVVTNQSLYV